MAKETRSEFEENVRETADFLEDMFERHVSAFGEGEACEPLVLRDLELSPIIHSVAELYPYRDIAEAFDAVALLNAAAYELENRLRAKGFSPSIRRGTICEFTYNIVSGYWYRDDVHWFSLDPVFVVEVEDVVEA